jgi:arginase
MALMLTTPIQELQVLAIRYLGGHVVLGERIPVDAYLDAGIYEALGVPFQVAEPVLPANEYTTDEVTNIGILGGYIADHVAAARRSGRAILMTGGNCCHITGVIGGLQDAHGVGSQIGLVWFDAHGDFNTTNTTLSGMLGGMPVAVAAGLTHPQWRELSHIVAPLPTDRIVLVDVRNLDPAEEELIRATDTTIAAVAPGFPGVELDEALADLVERVDLIYLHIDSDILDEAYTPNHSTKEPNGPSMDQVLRAIDQVMATGKVVAYAVVSVYGAGEGADIMVASGMRLIRGGLESWRKYGFLSGD